MDDDADPCGEFGERCYRLNKVGELAAKLTCTNFAVWHRLPAPSCQVYETNVDVLVVYSPSPILLDANFIPTKAGYCG
jgi:hypothetical protein